MQFRMVLGNFEVFGLLVISGATMNVRHYVALTDVASESAKAHAMSNSSAR